MDRYINNEEITRFLNRAQNKIADLSTLIVENGGYMPNSLTLLLELSDFLESLDNKYNTWTENSIIAWIHSYNKRANLNSMPFLLVTGYENNILFSEGGGFGLPITTFDVSDFIPATNALIRKSLHNTLSGLQGGKVGEKYHLTLAELLYLRNLMNPFTAPTVGLNMSVVPNVEWQEKGTIVNTVTLLGTIGLNSGVSVIKHRYKRLGRNPLELLVEANGGAVASFTHREDVRVNTTFRFEADFEEGGTKSADQTIKFIAPMWFGLSTRGKTASEIQNLTKVVEGPQNPRNFTYNLPSNNTTVPSLQTQVPYLLVSKSRGVPSRFEVETFDTLPDWSIKTAFATLADGTQEECWLCEFKNAVVGAYTYKVSWS